MNSVAQRFLSACRLKWNSLVVEPRATLVKCMILSEAPVGVDSPQEHPFADMPIPCATLEASSTVNVSLARDNITLSEVRDLLPRFHHFSRELVTHYERRLDPLSHQFVPIIDLHVRSTDRSCLDSDLNVSQTRLRSEGPWLIDGTGTRHSLDNCMHLIFQTIPLSCSPAFGWSVKRLSD